MNKQAKFFCENCGAEVPQSAKFCRKCGRFFTSVKCPNCGNIGPSTAFTNGCPKCGYADGKVPSHHTIQFNQNADYRTHTQFTAAPASNKSSQKVDNSLPAWIYALTIGILAGIIAAVIRLYMA